MNIKLHKFITDKLWTDNTPIKIDECIQNVMYHFSMSRDEAEKCVNCVLSKRP